MQLPVVVLKLLKEGGYRSTLFKQIFVGCLIPTDTMSFRGRFRREASELRRKRKTTRRVNQGEIQRLSCVSMHPSPTSSEKWLRNCRSLLGLHFGKSRIYCLLFM